MKKITFIILACIFINFLQAQDKKFLSNLDKYVEKTMKEFEVPGIALAIVKDGKIIVSKGFGIKKVGEIEPVDAKTRFGIASNSKAFTAVALALLVEEGKLEWDKPVINYLPWFQLGDPYITREITIRDLLVHRSGLGLGGGDLLLWPQSNYTRKEIVQRLKNVPIVKSFRSTYAYDNVLYLTAGEVIAEVSGQSWEDFVETRILKKLGMEETTTRCSSVEKGGNIALPHAIIEGKLQLVKPSAIDNTNPAAGINTGADDVCKWMKMLLDSGKISDKENLFSKRTTRQLWSVVTPMPIGESAPELKRAQLNFSGYALGFRVQDYCGRKIVWHTGGLAGYVSKITLLPDMNLGIAVFTNQESGEAFNSITYNILDHYIGNTFYDWVEAYKQVNKRQSAAAQEREQSDMEARNKLSKPSLSLEKYAGTYNDPWYGNISITLKNDVLNFSFSQTPGFEGKMEHFQYDTFIIRWNDREMRADAYITFSLNPDGTIEQAKMKAVSPSTDFSFDFHDLLLKPVKTAK
jgi:CubicO group peptidase (beta-lactamase class C family)